VHLGPLNLSSHVPVGVEVWVEGIIGAGKRSLAGKLGSALGFRADHEPGGSNPYLGLFYKDPKEHAYDMQIHLLQRRYIMQRLAADEAIYGIDYQGSILDRGLPGDRVFAKMHWLEGNISQLQFETYLQFYEVMCADLRPPSLMLFLDVEPEVALERVRGRKRPEEVNMTLGYLTDLRKGYLDLMAEIDTGIHPWSRGMEVQRIPWNVDHQPIDPLVEALRDKFKLRDRGSRASKTPQ